MYVVYDNNKKAQYPDHKVDESWENASFSSLTEAQEYAKDWLGGYRGVIPNDWNGKPINYSEYGDTIEIREE